MGEKVFMCHPLRERWIWLLIYSILAIFLFLYVSFQPLLPEPHSNMKNDDFFYIADRKSVV